jgi:hypothetical protein
MIHRLHFEYSVFIPQPDVGSDILCTNEILHLCPSYISSCSGSGITGMWCMGALTTEMSFFCHAMPIMLIRHYHHKNAVFWFCHWPEQFIFLSLKYTDGSEEEATETQSSRSSTEDESGAEGATGKYHLRKTKPTVDRFQANVGKFFFYTCVIMWNAADMIFRNRRMKINNIVTNGWVAWLTDIWVLD